MREIRGVSFMLKHGKTKSFTLFLELSHKKIHSTIRKRKTMRDFEPLNVYI
jgi:hypothetical protein